ncbi:MAG: insulinase family protein [Gemmatimonadetes bacterium]|nr:insulinase family protein [Gemmatimonadota bacterium]
MRPTALALLLAAALAGCSALRPQPPARVGASGAASADSIAGVDSLSRASTAAPVPLETRTLPNGLRVVAHRNPVVPLVTIEIDVKNGAYTQTPDYEGLAHLYEHMFFKANRAIPSQERWLERTRELGMAWNGTTSAERVNYYFTLHRDDLREGLEFMRDAIRYPLFDQGELERERPVVLGEYDRNESNPPFALAKAVDSLLWSPAYFSRKNTIGNREVIATTPREKMTAIQQRYYVPNNAALILAGDVEPAEVFRLAEEVFGDWERGADPFSTHPIPPVPPLAASAAVVVERPVSSVTLTMSWQGPSVTRNTAFTYAADLFSAALNLPGTGFQKRIVDSGLAFGAGMSYTTLSHVGPVTLRAQTNPEKLLPLRRALQREIDAFDEQDYFTRAQIEAARRSLEVADVYVRERPSGFAHTLGYWWAVANLQYYLNYVPNVLNVDRDDLAGFVRTYVQGRPRVTGVLIAPADRAKIALDREDLL